MWKEYNRRNKKIRRRWRSRYKGYNRRNTGRYKMIALLAVFMAVLIFLVIYAGSCIRDLANPEDEAVVGSLDVLSSVEIMPQATATPQPTSTPVPEDKTIIVLDAGHGGVDGGTFGGDIIEKNINLAIVKYIQEILAEEDVEIILTRTEDELMELQDRVKVADDAKADLFVSIHCNFYEDDERVSGLECYSCPGKEESAVLSETLIAVLKEVEAIKVRSAKEAEYYVLKHTDMPAVLVEVGFLSNKAEREKLNSADYQKIVAQGLAEGILLYLETEEVPESNTQSNIQ